MFKFIELSLSLLVVTCNIVQGQHKTDVPAIKSQTDSSKLSGGPGAITRTIRRDKLGNLWMAAFDGVFRYHDKTFVEVTRNVSSGRFFCVLEDRKGNFWFSSVGEGVYYYDGIYFRHFTTQDGLADNRVTEIYEDKAGHVWFGTEGGASVYDGTTFRNYRMTDNQNQNLSGVPTFTFDTAATFRNKAEAPSLVQRNMIHEPADNRVNAIIEDRTGKFWLGTRGNAFLYDGTTFNSFPHGSSFMNVRSIIEDKKGNIWLGGADGLWRFDGSAYKNFTRDFVGYVFEDSRGNIWTSSQTSHGWAISRYDGTTLSNDRAMVTEVQSDYAILERMVFGIAEAKDGSIWFGGLNGVYRYDGKSVVHQ